MNKPLGGVILCLRYMLTALLYLASVLVAVYALQSRDLAHCVIALLVLFVGGCVYLIAIKKELVGLPLSQKLKGCGTLIAYLRCLGSTQVRPG